MSEEGRDKGETKSFPKTRGEGSKRKLFPVTFNIFSLLFQVLRFCVLAEKLSGQFFYNLLSKRIYTESLARQS